MSLTPGVVASSIQPNTVFIGVGSFNAVGTGSSRSVGIVEIDELTGLKTDTLGFGIGLNHPVEDCIITPDNKILLGAGRNDNPAPTPTGFQYINLSSKNETLLVGASAGQVLYRFNSDGTQDTSFSFTGVPNSIRSFTRATSINNNHLCINANLEFQTSQETSTSVVDASGKPVSGPFISRVYRFAPIFNENNIYFIGPAATGGSNQSCITKATSAFVVDQTFKSNQGSGTNVTPAGIAVDSLNRVIVVGNFTSYNGTSLNRIFRLNADGTFDTTFNTNIGTGFNLAANVITLSGNKIIIGGDFTTFNGVAANRIVRLNDNGTRDNTFNMGTGFNHSDALVNNNFVQSIKIDPRGGVIVLGNFTSYNGTNRFKIARLFSTGALDTTIYSNRAFGNDFQNTPVSCIFLNNKILVTGSFTSYDNTSTNTGIYSFNINNHSDSPLFNFSNFVWSSFGGPTRIKKAPNKKIYISGNFTSYGGVTRNGILRLNADGTLDSTFNPGTGGTTIVNFLVIPSSGKLVLFLSNSNGTGTWNGATVPAVIGLNTDGTRDTSFTGSYNTTVTTLIELPGDPFDRFLVGGLFRTYNGVTVPQGLIRLFPDGSRDVSFQTLGLGNTSSGGIFGGSVTSDNKLYICGSWNSFIPPFPWGGNTNRYVVRLNYEGVVDRSFNYNGSSTNTFDAIEQPNTGGKVLITPFGDSIRNRNIQRYNYDGSRDWSFSNKDPYGLTPQITSTGGGSIQFISEGRILVVSTAVQGYNSAPCSGLIILDKDGNPNNLGESNIPFFTRPAASGLLYEY